MDKDGDGMISEQEAAAKPDLAKDFQKYDKNGDGTLEEAEFSQFECHAEKTCP
jgi:Ca2+-binding EF-hand superfamily protein